MTGLKRKAADEDEHNGVEVRRSSRAGKQRVLMINGHPVLKVNNYDLHDSSNSLSVFDYELKKKKRAKSDAAMGTSLQTIRQAAKPDIAMPLSSTIQHQPDSIKGQMREYQVAGYKFMAERFEQGICPILADEMGLGKTLQTIALLSYLTTERGICGPSLVICPLSVLSSWMTELARWAPHLRAVRVHVSGTEQKRELRKSLLSDLSTFDVAVTTYDMMKAQDLERALGGTIVWRVVVLDEGHKLKNEETQIARALRAVRHQSFVLLTGTPLQNNLHELYALLSFLHPDIFTTSKPFDDAFNLTLRKVDNEKLHQAHQLLRPFCLRRLKADVERSLPPRVETRIDCPLTKLQTFWYRRLLLKDARALLSLESQAAQDNIKVSSGDNNWKKLMSLIIQLRKACQHPYLLDEPDFDGNTTGEDIVMASGKLEVLDRLLAKLKAKGHRVVLFCQWNKTLDIIEDFLIMRRYKYFRLDGSINRAKRAANIRMFNQPGSDAFIYILNTRAGGLGVNLQTADTCILFDSDWNPQWDLQAMARVHRIGQTKPVHAYRLCTTGTVEERMQLRAEQKLYLAEMVTGARYNEEGQDLEGLSSLQMLSMLRFGAERIFTSASGLPPSDAELDAITARSSQLGQQAAEAQRSKDATCVIQAQPAQPDSSTVAQPVQPESSTGVLKQRVQTAADFDADQVPLSTFMLNGTDYTDERAEKAIEAELLLHKRQSKPRLVNINGFDVLLTNNYTLQQGEPSVFDREGKRYNKAEKGYDKRCQSHFEHSDLCQVCWDGGELLMCPRCPVTCHAECVGADPAAPTWSCPHHWCEKCRRTTVAAGGMLYRCQACTAAFCEDCLPDEALLTDDCPRFNRLGYPTPTIACFVVCSAACKDFMAGHHFLFKPETLDDALRGRD
ncbi:hypothetical protein WJX73_007480 [Symbiochloris irregularis]|uniref:Uncharacterized protein n=1 Tax=Symbiochloris irregularis TaxID=706552 RepID=A0AAW1NL65_9CHLO